jgi:hypothetical protein
MAQSVGEDREKAKSSGDCRTLTAMGRRRPVLWQSVVIVALGLACSSPPVESRARTARLPARLTDQEFWRLSASSSEPGGYFRAQNITNITSNELGFEYVIPDLLARAKTGGVYLGVGPEQNYTYMAALEPALAVIFDVRRGNLDLQLMYKAIFELSKDRADFVSMLFAKPRPDGLTTGSSASALFNAFARSTTSEALYRQNLGAIEDHLTKTHALPLPADDLKGIEDVYETFYWNGFSIRSSPTYADLMTATDEAGVPRSYLATEANFAFLKDLEARNLVVPVVGNFAGPKAIRAIGAYLKAQGATVSAFYLSNVEQYLYQDGLWEDFCRNVATLPLDASSTFIRSSSGGRGFGGGFRGGFGRGFVSSLGKMAEESSACRQGG